MQLLSHLLKRFVRNGRLRVTDAGGATHSFGTGQDGPDVAIRLHSKEVERKLFFNPELAAAEAYMDGMLTVEDGGDIFDFLSLFSANRSTLGGHPVQKALRNYWRKVRRIHQFNPLGKAASNARHHYDLSHDLYRLFLGPSMQYSCGYFHSPEDSLDEAQDAKLRHIAAKLVIEPGMRVVEIGCGWGGLAIELAASCGAEVTALNVSSEQISMARERAAAAGVGDRVTFVECDYREFTGRFDRVVSVGMMEHVGVSYYDTYFAKIRELLKPGGVALVHAIGRMSPPGTTAPFIRKYIFPGGYVPAMSEVFASTERTGLWVADNEILRLHYYYTICHWRRNFAARRAEAAALYDERFCRMWEFYLAAVELGFLTGSNMVFQLLLSSERDAVPIVRDFITDGERQLAETMQPAKMKARAS